jgi:hypothetical protein
VAYSGEVRRGEAELLWEQQRSATELLASDAGALADVLSALANPVRHAIVRALLDRPLSLRELQDRLDLSSPGLPRRGSFTTS